MIAVNAAKTVYSGTAAADTFQVSAKLSKKFNKNITVDGLAGNDTIQFLGFTKITRDIVFSNVSNVEILQLFDDVNKKLVLGTFAADAGFSTVYGGSNSDTIDLTSFDANITVSTGDGTDTVTSQSGDYNLSIDLGAGADSIYLKSSEWTQNDSVAGGAGADTIFLQDVGTISDDDFTNFATVENLTLLKKGKGDSNTTLASNALSAGVNNVTGGKKSNDSINIEGYAGNITINSLGGSDTITTQSGNYQLSVDAGSGEDTVIVSSEYFDNNDVLVGGTDKDTLKITGTDSVVDAAFFSTSGFEIIHLDDNSSNVTVGSTFKANNKVKSFYAYAGDDVLNFEGLKSSFKLFAGDGDDTVTTSSSSTNLSIDAGSGDDSITVTTSKLGNSDSIAGGTGSDTLSVTGSGKVVDKDFANLSSIEILAISGVTKLKLGKKASSTGISDVQVTGDVGLVNISNLTNAV